jgi:hypothetical protein
MKDDCLDAAYERRAMQEGLVKNSVFEVNKEAIDAHYTKLKIQPMIYSMENKLDPMQATIIKYVTRFRDKGGKRDLLAALKTLDMLIEYEYGNANN